MYPLQPADIPTKRTSLIPLHTIFNWFSTVQGLEKPVHAGSDVVSQIPLLMSDPFLYPRCASFRAYGCYLCSLFLFVFLSYFNCRSLSSPVSPLSTSQSIDKSNHCFISHLPPHSALCCIHLEANFIYNVQSTNISSVRPAFRL